LADQLVEKHKKAYREELLDLFGKSMIQVKKISEVCDSLNNEDPNGQRFST